MKKRLPHFALLFPFLILPLAMACAAGGGIEPIEIDLSKKKVPAPTATPAPVAPPVAATTPVPAPPMAASSEPPSAGIASGRTFEGPPCNGPFERIVRDRIDAFNRSDLEALVAAYTPDARVYDPPDRVRDAGTDGIRAALARELASSPGGPIVVSDCVSQGAFVVQRETRGDTRALVVYEVRVGRIANVWILR